MSEYVLSNRLALIRFMENGLLASLEDAISLRAWQAKPGALFRVIYSDGASLEEEILSNIFKFKCLSSGHGKLVLEYTLDDFMRVVVSCSIAADGSFLFDCEAENLSDSHTIREFQFPYLSETLLTPATRLHRNSVSGEFHNDVEKWLESCSTAYMAPDEHARESSCLYPGACSMNFFILEDTEAAAALYFGCHDPSFSNTLHLARKRCDGGTAFCFVKYPMLAPGKSVRFGEYVLAPLSGSWRRGAEIYRQWAEKTWFRPHSRPAWLSTMNAWQRIIMRHQYGKIFFRHDEMPRLLADGLACGINTLFMFGWWREGMDAGYPEYAFDESQGGEAALREHIRRFQAGSGHVILYFNGQLIDTLSGFYRSGGKRISCKLPDGETEYQEFYRFGGAGTALRTFGNRTFVTACPSCTEWLDVLKGLVDKAVSLGCDGVFFDQLGWTSYPCCDPSHGHETPFMTVGASKRELVKKLYMYTKSRAPEMAFGIEWVCDITGEFTDFIHNISGCWENADEELYRYTFPEFAVSDRCIRDDTDIEKRVNWAFCLGLRSDIEIFRCRADIAAAPVYMKYLKKINSIRSKYADLLFNGIFRDTEGASVKGENIHFSVYEKDLRTLVVITADADTSGVSVSVPGKRLVSSAGDENIGSMAANSVVALEFA